MDESTQSYILLLLADGNLPTGSFVASSGLESYVKHGFFTNSSSSSSTATAAQTNKAIVDFIQDSLGTYARSALPFVSDAHIAMSRHNSMTSGLEESLHRDSEASTLQQIKDLDFLYESMTLNEVTRRASKAQGVALLTLFSKGFSSPLMPHASPNTELSMSASLEHFVDHYKLIVRREEAPGHLPICWGILTATLGLSLDRSQHLHLFLHARSLLSAAIRLNILGPYAAQQVLLHVVRDVVAQHHNSCKDLRSGLSPGVRRQDGEEADDFDGPATTWPLGEILAARHDLQHSRIFNS
ncbi:hypothetical protein BD410DRAFT_353859 [Rickenella mellea]|uniref:Urease accessory protein UreF n=1 Tax=Rickenella mellea TaxID=50990 RepID=A0A4Y7QKS9_9AGAM|nr:hypothetical protein BD410DRAFT_353859 [Rickenella mellea]